MYNILVKSGLTQQSVFILLPFPLHFMNVFPNNFIFVCQCCMTYTQNVYVFVYTVLYGTPFCTRSLMSLISLLCFFVSL